MVKKEIDVFNYFDYREYLRDLFDEYKKAETGFTYRSFARQAGIMSQTYMLRVINGTRSLSPDYLPNICAFFRLNQSQARYFEALTAFNNEKHPERKEELLKKIISLRYSKDVHRIADKKLRFYERWYYPVVRELVTIIDFKNDYNLLARLCRPRITAVQARGAVRYLLANDFIRKNPDGTFRQTHQVISTGPEVDSTILRKYYRQIMHQCMDAIDNEKREERDISSLTLSVSENKFRAIKTEIQEFRKRLLAMAKEDYEIPERVCLISMQMIPRSKRVKRSGRGTI